MSTYRLDQLFAPHSIALVGASPRAGSLGHAVLRNLRAAISTAVLHPVNPRHQAIDGLACVKSLADLAGPPDLVVIVTPPHAVAAVVRQACAIGAAAAVILTAGLGHGEGSIAEEVRQMARRNGMRVVGPNCIGVVAPGAGLDASFLSKPVQAGNLALISQSGAIVAALAEWASDNHVGFSGIVSLGDQIDVDFADCLDHFAIDSKTDAILLYIEAIHDARKFLSAARAAARTKPVIVVKAGRHAAGAKAALSHTGALTGADAVYDAAFRRAGLLRVVDLDELFAAAATLSRSHRLNGERIGILTNGGGIGVLAVDRLIDLGGEPAVLSAATLAALDACLPNTWSRANPVDIIGDADAGRYSAALQCLLNSGDMDAILVLNCPTALVSSAATAEAVAKTLAAAQLPQNGIVKLPAPVFAVWLGERAAAAPIFEAAGVPHFASEVDAVRGIMHLVDYRRAQDALLVMPPSIPAGFVPDVVRARSVVDAAVAASQRWLDPMQVTHVLESYGIAIARCVKAANREEAETSARELLQQHRALAMKILSPDISHKSDSGGVRLGLRTALAVGEAFVDMLAAVTANCPGARLEGVMLQPMIERPDAFELIAGLADDPTFGPVILFGQGGKGVETINDKALALPPLDLKLAHDLISQTRISRLMAGYRDVPAADVGAVAGILVRLSHLSADIPEITELDLNPLLADAQGAIAVDARISVAKATSASGKGFSNPRFAIRPYPREWEAGIRLSGGLELELRPLRPEDAHLYGAFFAHVSRDDLYRRFFSSTIKMTSAFVARLTQIDYARTMVFLALDKRDGALAGVVRLHADANHEHGEYAVLVRSDFQGRGIGWVLMQHCISFAKAEGLQSIEGPVLSSNADMLKMCTELGFTILDQPEVPEIKNVRLELSNRQGKS